MKKTVCTVCMITMMGLLFTGCDTLTTLLPEQTEAPADVTDVPDDVSAVPVVTDHPNFNTNGTRTPMSGPEQICSELGVQYFHSPRYAEDVSCSIIGGTIGDISFTYNGVDMYYRAAKTTTADISGLGKELAGNMSGTRDVGLPSNNATVIFYSFDGGQERIARWKFGDTQYCLVCTKGMRESAFIDIAVELGQSTSPDQQEQ